MELGAILRLGHALAGVSFIAGMVGFWVVLGLARRAESIGTMRMLIRASDPFGRLLSGGGIGLTILGIATAIALGRPLFGPLTGGRLDWLALSNVLMLPIFGFLIAVYPQFGRRLRAALLAAEPGDIITPDIRSAWADPIYRFARWYELVAVLVVFGLMVAKPF